jgi:hypothetical protein
MAADPQFASIPIVGSAVVSATAETSYTAPTTAVTLLAATSPRQFTDGSTTSGSTTLGSTANAQFKNGDVGRSVSGVGIPAGTLIQFVTSPTAAIMSQPATANGSGLTLTLGGGIGLKVEEVDATGTGVTLAGIINLYLYDGTVYHIAGSIQVTGVTPSTSTKPFSSQTFYTNLWLPPGWSLVAASFVASQLINLVAYAGAL